MAKTWFNVDKEGLRALQAGKSKTFIINELTQNAWDEDITVCDVKIKINKNKNEICVQVTDDNPIGFRDIGHAYTLFADTYKREDPTKRGRFNLGEKQVLSICNRAEVSTTKGTVIFNDEGRKQYKRKREKGSCIAVWFNGTQKEMEELIDHAKKLLVPPHIQYIVNEEHIPSHPILKSFKVSLDTQILRDEAMVTTSRITRVDLIETEGKSYIYEMGIPIVETDCQWSIDVQQKVPLAVDRETIQPYYLKDLFAEIINHAHELITEEHSSDLWVRTGMKDERCKKAAIKQVIEKRFGDRFVSANPFDPNANDDALSNGYNVIHGSEMSKEEWKRIKELGLISSSTEKFGSKGIQDAKPITPTEAQENYAYLARRVAKEVLGLNILVAFVNERSPVRACYNDTINRLTFNIGHPTVGPDFFDEITWENLRLLIHELGHSKGNHTEKGYHYCLTELGGKMIMKALKDPSFFEVN